MSLIQYFTRARRPKTGGEEETSGNNRQWHPTNLSPTLLCTLHYACLSPSFTPSSIQKKSTAQSDPDPSLVKRSAIHPKILPTPNEAA
jgi:hypothetical protein